MSNFSSSNKFRYFCWVLFFSLVSVSYVGINFLSAKYFCRKLFVKSSNAALSDNSKKILENLKSDVEIFVLLEKTQEYAEVFDMVQKDIRFLMKKYAHAERNKRFDIEIINIAENGRRYATLCERFGILPANCIIVVTNAKEKVLPIDEFYRIRNGKVIAFKGESVVSSAMKELSSNDNNVIYCISGHGEYDLDSTSLARGLSALKIASKQKNYDIRPLNLCDSKEIPEDADLLIVAGARNKFFGFEQELLHDFVDNRHGKLIVALDGNYDIGLKSFLGDYEIFVGDRLLVPCTDHPTGYFEDLIIKRFASHRINERLIEFKVPLVFGATYEVKQAPWFVNSDKFSMSELIQTDDDVMENNHDEICNSRSFVVAAMAERKIFDISGQDRNSGKILVVGNSDFLSNGKFKMLGNRLFWFGIADYMIRGQCEEEFEDVESGNYRLAISKKVFLKILLKFSIVPAGFFLLAMIVAFIRRK